MDELTRQKASPEETEKWLGLNPEIVVTGTKEKPFYQIVYFDTIDKMLHIGFGSYKLEFVFDWLKEYFGQERATVSDREPEVKVAFEHRWIPVTERLPKLWEDIIAYDARNKEIRFAAMGEDVWYGVRMNGKVTHWMPLPEPPKEGE